MSRGGIPNMPFNTTVTLQRRSNTTDSVGDFTSVWNTIASAVKATIRPMSVKELKEIQGKEYKADHKGYIPVNISTTPVNGDRIIDTETNKTYSITGVQKFTAANINVTTAHHYKLFLEITRDTKS